VCLDRLRHPNIVLVMGISLVDQEPVAFPKTRTLNGHEDPDGLLGKKKSITKPQKTVCIITEYLEQGSLADILYGPTQLPAEIWTYELILACALQAARGMLYLHSHQPSICHRDLKSSNLVVDDHWVVKVTDFGMSRIVPEKLQELDKGIGDEGQVSIGRESMGDLAHAESRSSGSIMVTSGVNSYVSKKSSPSSHPRPSCSAVAPEMTSNMGTTAWCAPEILTASSRARYSVKVDVYSFGMVLWELWEKKRPFDECSSRFDIMDAVRAGKRPIISDNCPPAYKALIQRCWQTEPSRRPMFHYVVRYIKDELARVKRQKVLTESSGHANGNSRFSAAFFRPSSSSSSQLLSGMQPNPTLGSNAVQGFPGASSIKRNSLPTPAAIVDRSDHSSIASPLHPPPTAAVGGAAGGAVTSIQEGNIKSETEDMKLPEGRTPLVKAVDRPLSFRIESPPLDSTYLDKHYNSTGRLSLPNNWRDRYVMKFSGWNAAQPDTGLPPSLSLGGASSSSPINSSQLSIMRASSSASLDTEQTLSFPGQRQPELQQAVDRDTEKRDEYVAAPEQSIDSL
jgi:serine/threonine protein kinase